MKQAGRILQQLSLAWRSLPEKKFLGAGSCLRQPGAGAGGRGGLPEDPRFVKAANAVAKLDLGKERLGTETALS